MTIDGIEAKLVELEKEYWRALSTKNVEAAMRLTEDPCIVTGAQGVASLDHATFEKMMKAGDWTLKNFELADVTAQRVTDDVAIVAYKVKENLTVDGKPVTLEAADASTWVRRDGQWRCALHTESITGDPYGRDRDPDWN
jgi:hypothetical protein